MAIMTILALAMTGILPALAQTEAHHFVVKNVRTAGPNSVRGAAAQGTENMPNIALLGGSKEVWATIKTGVQQAEDKGCPVRAVLIGPVDVEPSLEIYAKGHHVTNPILPAQISAGELTKLICDVNKEFYPK